MTNITEINPSSLALGKYSKWNTLLLVLLIYKAYTQLFPYQLLVRPDHAFPVLMNGIFIYLVASKKIKYYLWVGLFFIAVIIYVLIREIIMDFEQYFFDPIYNFDHTGTILSVLLNLTCCILLFWLKVKILPKKSVQIISNEDNPESINYQDYTSGSDYDDEDSHPMGHYGLEED